MPRATVPMMRHISIALLACVLSAAPQAQPKPDFSGIWMLDCALPSGREATLSMHANTLITAARE